MRSFVILAALALLAIPALAPVAAAGPYVPPVCLQKSASVAQTSVTVQLTCGIWLEVAHCPPVGDGPCRALIVGPVLP